MLLLLFAALFGTNAQINFGLIPSGGLQPMALFPYYAELPAWHLDAPVGTTVRFTIALVYQDENYAFDDLPVVTRFIPGNIPQNTQITNENCTSRERWCYVEVTHQVTAGVPFILTMAAEFQGGPAPQSGPTITLDQLPAIPPAPPVIGQWNLSNWSTCNRDCGGGFQTRKVNCVSNGIAVDGFNCPYPQPLNTQWCNNQRCAGAYYWRNYPFYSIECTSRCSDTYHYAPPSACKAGTGTSTTDTTVAAALCTAVTPGPLSNQPLCPNAEQCSYQKFSYGSCSNGVQARTVQCIDYNKNPRDTSDCLLDNSFTRPSKTRACMADPTIDAKATLPIAVGESVLTIIGTNLDGGEATIVYLKVDPQDLTFPDWIVNIISNTSIEVRFSTPLSSAFENHKISVKVSNGNVQTTGWIIPGEGPEDNSGFSAYTRSLPLLLAAVMMATLFLGHD